jgi:2-polyprenyl-3-methyl-5-hydroxy-6-metoxy-1,4-benzoquinol methylase
VIAALRRLGLLGLADAALSQRAAHEARAINASVRAAHTHITFPPAALVFEVQGYARLDWFMESGARQADALAALIGAHAPATTGPIEILEWGCGPGRLLRPLQARLGRRVRLSGCDPLAACVAGARRYVAGVEITQSRRAPPAPYPAAQFDGVYGVSILTHLPTGAAAAWMKDIARLLRPGGLAILTTHGPRHASRLDAKAAARFAAGAHVALTGAAQGSRTFASYTPPAAMAAFAAGAGLTILAHLTEGPQADAIGQDIWLLRKP